MTQRLRKDMTDIQFPDIHWSWVIFSSQLPCAAVNITPLKRLLAVRDCNVRSIYARNVTALAFWPPVAIDTCWSLYLSSLSSALVRNLRHCTAVACFVFISPHPTVIITETLSYPFGSYCPVFRGYLLEPLLFILYTIHFGSILDRHHVPYRLFADGTQVDIYFGDCYSDAPSDPLLSQIFSRRWIWNRLLMN